MTVKKNVAEILGDDESYQDFCDELNRRAAVLDFLCLYRVAKEEEVVQRVKHIIHADGFSEFKPKHWEMYLTRLLGRCLRHVFPGYQAVEKQRNSFTYQIYPRRGANYAQYYQIIDLRKMIDLDWPWYPHGTNAQAYRSNSQLYWRTRGLADPIDVDAMYAAWNQFIARTDKYDRCQIYSNVLSINYGSKAYIRRAHGTNCRLGSYHAYQAFNHLKGWMEEADRFLENNSAIFDTYRLLEEHDRTEDNRIEEEIRESAREAADIARERAQKLRDERAREAQLETAVEEQQERELTLAENMFENLREKGLVE